MCVLKENRFRKNNCSPEAFAVLVMRLAALMAKTGEPVGANIEERA
jgi:hypothetical protein